MKETQTQDEISKRNVSMFGYNWAVVDEINTRHSFGNVSMALRYIISEYVRLSQQEAEQRTN